MNAFLQAGYSLDALDEPQGSPDVRGHRLSSAEGCESVAVKTYRLIGADGVAYDSETPGVFGGRTGTGGRGFRGVYGRLDCSTALKAIAKGGVFAKYRVFFEDEGTAIAAGFRPCAHCLKAEYAAWKAAQPA